MTATYDNASSDPVSLLAGLRVVELSGNGIAAGLVGMLLADHGAEVIRVAHPDFPPPCPVLEALLGRSKTERTFAWDHAHGREHLQKLVTHADVVVYNDGGPGAPSPGLDWAELRKTANRGLVRCAIKPFPDFDPRSTLPGHEAVAGAAGFVYSKPLGRSQYHSFPMGSVIASLYAAGGIVAALIARHRHGWGQDVETSLYQAGIISQVLQVFVKSGVPRGFLALKMVGSPAMRCWPCQDGRYVYLHITLPAHNQRLLELLAEHGLESEAARLRSVMSAQTMLDPSQVKSIAEAKKIKGILGGIFRQKTADQWETLLGEEICCIKVRSVDEWLQDSADAGMSDACRIDDPVFGELLAPGAQVTSPDIKTHVRPRVVDQAASDEMLDRWQSAPSPQVSPAGQASDPTTTPPLEGIRVLDLSRIIAGPCAARYLAELGAEVVSVQSMKRLDWALSFHLIFNAGKKSVVLDFTNEEGKKRLWSLMDAFNPHALIQNYRSLDVAREAGVDPDTVRRRYPHMAYAYLNAYGNHGRWKERPGFEQVVQAVSGIQLAYGGGKPKLLPSPIIDIGCGLLGAFGTLLGLYQRARSGRGAYVTTHLTNVAVLLQLPSIAALQRPRALERAKERGVAVRYDSDAEIIATLLHWWWLTAVVAGPRRDVREWLQEMGVAQQRPISLRVADIVADLGMHGRHWLDQAALGNPNALVQRCAAALSDLSDTMRRQHRELSMSHKRGIASGQELQVAQRHFSWLSMARWSKALESAGMARRVALVRCGRIGQVVREISRHDPRPMPILRKVRYPGCSQPLAFLDTPIHMSLSHLPRLAPPTTRGGDTAEIMADIGATVPDGHGGLPYPADKPLIPWVANVVRWGYFAWRSGNI